ncbi:mediator of RNA polymerase II transcription subunit 15a-like isoform X2 [Gastrolobium bilobum]|uniref:mediator of RNA polymerase II transcription subunit 15a-like isoform X2 n=1 Tax=Gastrolobium bilobum TaxID=150636 RepID=UPI002AB20737|nr:mediator of RNA polymerase II transcription subunit 15a-like isoform X2 [Gastrolobium bilobum]
MDTNNWRPNQGNEPNMDASEWRGQLQPESRQRIVNKIMDTLKRHLPVSGQEGLHELRKIAQRFEEKIFTAATSQSDYLRKISLKMLTMETKSQGTMANNMPLNQGGPSNQPPDPGLVMQPQVHNPGPQHPISLPNQPQSRQQLLSQNIQNNSACQPNLPPVSSLAWTSIQNVGQNSNMQNIPGQILVGSTIGQNSHMQNMFAGSQRQMQGRQQVVPQQQQQQSQNPQQYLYQQQQLQLQLLKHKLQLQQQQQQQNLLQSNQLQSSQQSVMQTPSVMQQPSMMQTSSLSSIQHNQQSNNIQQSTQSMLQQHPQVIRQQPQQQTSIIHQQQTPMTQQSILPPQQQQQQQLMGAQTEEPSGGDWREEVYQKIKTLKENHLPELNEMYQKIATKFQQHDSLPNQPKSEQLEKLKVFKIMLERIITFLQVSKSNITPHFKEKLGPYEKQIINFINTNRSRKAVSSLQPGQLPPPHMHSLSQSQSQATQVQSHENQMNTQLQTKNIRGSVATMQQNNMTSMQHNSLSGLSTTQNLYQSQRPLPETSSNSLDSTAQTGQPSGGDWQEEVYQKIKTMKENYLPELNEVYQKIATKFQQHDSLPNQPKSEQLEKLKVFKIMLERIITFLQVSKSNITPHFKEILGPCEKQIINFINTNRSRKTVSSLQPGQLPPPHMHSLSQSQSQVTQVQSHENQMNTQLQTTNIRGSVATMQQNNMTRQGNAMNSLQQVPMSSLQQNTVSAPQQSNVNSLSSQAGVNVIKPNLNPLQPGSSILQHQQLKQHQEQQMLQTQQFKQQYHQLTALEASDLESTATSSIKKPRIAANHALLEETKEVNQQLIDTIVDISDEEVDPTAAAAAAEGEEGTIVKCSFSTVALSPSLKSQYASAQMSPIQSLRLIVPTNYSNCSALLLDKFPVESRSKDPRGWFQAGMIVVFCLMLIFTTLKYGLCI